MYKSKTRIQISTLLIALAMAGTAHAKIFNVTNGTQLQAALTEAQNNDQGDTINLAAGTYDASGGTFTYIADRTVGSEENFPLTLQGAGANTTILDGGNARSILNIQKIDRLSDDSNADVTIQGMTFRRGHGDPIAGALEVITGDADIVLKNCDFLFNTAEAPASFDHGVVSLATGNFGGTGNILVDGNNFLHNSSQSNSGAADFFVEGGSIVVTNNIFFDNHSAASFGGAVTLSRAFDISGQPIQFINNTVVGNSTSLGDGGGIFISYSETTDTHVDLYNNIIFGNTTTAVGKDVFVFDFRLVGDTRPTLATVNLFNNDFSEICFRSSGACDPSAITSLSLGGQINIDPKLIDPTHGDFHLAVGSPAINKGDPNAPALPATDHDGNPRIIGPAPDIGAFEFLTPPVTPPPVTPPPTSPPPSAVPTPTSSPVTPGHGNGSINSDGSATSGCNLTAFADASASEWMSLLPFATAGFAVLRRRTK